MAPIKPGNRFEDNSDGGVGPHSARTFKTAQSSKDVFSESVSFFPEQAKSLLSTGVQFHVQFYVVSSSRD